MEKMAGNRVKGNEKKDGHARMGEAEEGVKEAEERGDTMMEKVNGRKWGKSKRNGREVKE